jgi:hypothetical protein
MNKKQSMMIAMAGAVLVAASQAQAQINYQNEDLLLNFRNTANTGAADVSVDLGPISTFLARTGTTVLNNGASSGYTPLFTEANLLDAFGGSLANVGFTAVAVDSASQTTWVTRAGTTQNYGDYPPDSVSATLVGDAVGGIGAGLGGAYATVVTHVDGNTNIASVASGQMLSYQSLASGLGQPSLINFTGENTTRYDGGSLESVVSTSGSTVYSALYLEPAGAAYGTYLGYFTLNGTTGELDYSAFVPVPCLSIAAVGTGVRVSWADTGWPTTTFTL